MKTWLLLAHFLGAAWADVLSETLSLSDSTLPHCKRTTVVTGEVMQESLETTELSVSTTVQLQLGLAETACFHVHVRQPNNNKSAITYNETLMYSLQFLSLEDHHPIRHRYQFGIPQLRSHCVCDCPGGDNHCAVGFSYKNCSRGSACYTTYHPQQSATGCPAGTNSELCCEVSLQPYKNWQFWSLNLGLPDSTVASFVLKLYSQERRGTWSVRAANRIYVPLDSRQAFTLGRDRLRLSVSGSTAGRHLTPGQYMVRESERKLRTGAPLNDLREWDMGKLGWFRRLDGKWQVRGGWVKFQDAHHVQVSNCKAQQYSDSFNAQNYVSDSETGKSGTYKNFYLGHTVEDFERWVDTAEVRSGKESRFAVVSHKFSPALTLDMTMDNRPVIKFFHHRSELKDFSGEILLDKFSNRFLNISFSGAKGTLLGNVYRSMAKERIDVAFSTYVHSLVAKNHSTILSVPATVNGSRWVCFTPSGDEGSEKCKWFRYHSTPLPWYVVPHQWNLNQGECEGCNEMSVSNFLQYLNPRQWLDGISSTSEAIAFGVEIGFYIIMALLIIGILRKCVCPFLKWTLAGNSAKKPSDL